MNPTKRAGANLAPKGPEKDHEILAKQHLGHPMNGFSLIKMAPEDIGVDGWLTPLLSGLASIPTKSSKY